MNNNLLINESPLLLIPSLAKKIGLNESIILQQLHYWIQRSKNVRMERKWVYFTYENLVEQFPFFSKSTIRRTIVNLENQGLLTSGNFNKMKMDHTKWYTINYEKLEVNNISSPMEDPQYTNGTLPSIQNDHTKDSFPIDDAPTMNKRSTQLEHTIPSQVNSEMFKMDSAIPESSTKNSLKTSTKTISTTGIEENTAITSFQFYEQNEFGGNGHFIAEKIKAWCIDLSDELVMEAMKTALENGSKRWSYVEAILVYWVDKGYQKVEEVHAAKHEYKKRQNQNKGSKRPIRREMVPNWLLNKEEQPTTVHNDDFLAEKRIFMERYKRQQDN